MKLCIFKSGVIAGCLAMAAAAAAQQPAQPAPGNPAPTQQTPAKPAGSNANPFPGDITNVPVMPNATTSAQPEPPTGDAAGGVPAPASDSDPARSPDEMSVAQPARAAGESSSSVPDMDKLLPRDDEETKRKGGKQDAPEFKETAAGDIDVGNFELQRHNWRGALSRFQSAMVIDPENPEAFWGMAEAARHLGDYANARMWYQKVADYDPDSKHGKEAIKALKQPEIANAQAAKAPLPPQK